MGDLHNMRSCYRYVLLTRKYNFHLSPPIIKKIDTVDPIGIEGGSHACALLITMMKNTMSFNEIGNSSECGILQIGATPKGVGPDS